LGVFRFGFPDFSGWVFRSDAKSWSSFFKKLAEAIGRDDYYGAEELRLGRINELKDLLTQSLHFWPNSTNSNIRLVFSIRPR